MIVLLSCSNNSLSSQCSTGSVPGLTKEEESLLLDALQDSNLLLATPQAMLSRKVAAANAAENVNDSRTTASGRKRRGVRSDQGAPPAKKVR